MSVIRLPLPRRYHVYILCGALCFSHGIAPAAPLQKETLQEIDAQLALTPDDTALLATKGAMQRQAQDHTGAIATYEKLLAINPGDIRARNLLTMVLHNVAQEAPTEEALALLRRAIALSPQADFLKPDYLAAVFESGTPSQLITAYEALPAGYEVDVPVLVAVADAYRQADQYAAAIAIYRLVLDATPADPDAGLGMAMALLDSDHVFEARQAIQHTISMNPDQPALLLALASIQWQSGDLAMALNTFDRILEIDPAHAKAINMKAQLLCDSGCISLAQDVVTAYPTLIWKYVRDHIAARTAKAQAAWNEQPAPTNALPELRPDSLLALCYYNVTDKEINAPPVIGAERFLEQIEYLRTHGYRFVSAGDVAAAQRDQITLPPNAILLTFDHGYTGLLEHVVPVLELYKIPAIVSICPAWIEHGPPMDLSGPLMSWNEVAMLGGHRLITLGIEAEGLYELVCANPQGDAGFAAITRIYDAEKERYETETEQQERIQATLSHAVRLVQERVGIRPRILVWSHGARNTPAAAAAERLGFALQLGLRATPCITTAETLERIPVLFSPSIGTFISLVKPPLPAIKKVRAVSVSMDRLDDSRVDVVDQRVGQLINRLQLMGANTVILSACADVNSDGNVEATYFPTTQLPVLHDVLDHVVARLHRAGIKVWLDLPVLSFLRPASPRNETLRVMETKGDAIRPSFSAYKRYSPFQPEVVAWTDRLYRDLAEHVRCDGIVFGEDAYLTDTEDFNAAARRVYADRLGTPTPGATLSDTEQHTWMRLKTDTLNQMTLSLAKQVARLRPHVKIARTLYAPVLHYPQSERWFAQNFDDALTLYDHVLLMAYAELEDIHFPEPWLAKLVDLTDAKENGLEKTIFKIHAVDGERNNPIKGRTLASRLRHLTHNGALHVAYGPDAPTENVPPKQRLKNVLSSPTRPRK